MSQFGKPSGFFGKILARGMAWGHRDFYKNTAEVLDLQQDDKYLEIGFGSGLFIKKYASHVARIAGIDLSEEMANMARSINKKLIESEKAEFIQGNASSLPWGDSEFSVVVGIETFFFWQEPTESLMEIYRVLAPGGRLVLEMAYNKEDGLDHTEDVEKMNLTLYSAAEMTGMLQESGFSEIEFTYYKGFWLPFKGHVVPKGMIVKAVKK
jgi:ubiquinone/menaquinone biosynthesis C-methylase UbiE